MSFTLGAFILIPLGFNNGGLSKTGLELPCFGHSYLILRCWCGMRTLFVMHFLKSEESFTMRIFCKCANYGLQSASTNRRSLNIVNKMVQILQQ